MIASGAAALALLLGGWFLGVQPQLAAAATAASTATNVQTQNQATRMKLAGLTRAAAKSDSMQIENARLLKAVPSILKPNTFIRRINEVAALDGVEVLAITPSNAVAYSAPVAANAAGGLVLAKTSPLINPGNFAVVPVTVSIKGDSDSVVQFMHDIQNDERTFSISVFQIGKDGEKTGVSASLSGSIYTLRR